MLRQRLASPYRTPSARFALKQSVTLRTSALRSVFAMLLFTGVAHAATFNGTVFEDVNYGGGAGRSLAALSGVGIEGVRVELYRVSSGALVDSDTTDGNGEYSLSSGGGGAGGGPHVVRVVNGTVRSSRSGGLACTTCVPIQTFRTTGLTNNNTPVAVTDRVGGENPAISDAPSHTSGATLASLTVTNVQTPQSISTIDPSASNATLNNIDLGLNFSTIVKTRDATGCT